MITKLGAHWKAKALGLTTIPVTGTGLSYLADRAVFDRPTEEANSHAVNQTIGGLAGMSGGAMLGSIIGAGYGLMNRKAVTDAVSAKAPGGFLGKMVASKAFEHMPGVAKTTALGVGTGLGLLGGMAAGGLIGAGAGRLKSEIDGQRQKAHLGLV